jgi:hypothetical protein
MLRGQFFFSRGPFPTEVRHFIQVSKSKQEAKGTIAEPQINESIVRQAFN